MDWDNLRQKTPEYVPIIENIKDTGNFERKKEYLEKEKENPLFAVETNSQQVFN